MKRILLPLLLLALACTPGRRNHVNTMDSPENILATLMNGNPELAPFLSNKDALNIQVIYTRIDRDRHNEPRFTDYRFNVNANRYFYPASTVKMPVAFLALEKLNGLREKGIDKYTAMSTDSASQAQSAKESTANIAHNIKQIFLVSDNDANNRLYEFLGQEYLYEQLKKKGLDHSVIRHRLSVSMTPEQHRHTNAVSFYDTAGKLLYNQPAQYSKAQFPVFNDKLGKGYYDGKKLVNEPFDFSLKNHVALTDLHQVLKAMIFPHSVKAHERFDISEDDRLFLLRWMSSFPRESKDPFYDTAAYPDDYAKFVGRKILPNPNIRIFSKSGWAYGFLTDVAYVVDFEKGVEFMLSATILCNSDGIFNDDEYDFEKTGYPFMKALGQAIYQYELQRPRKQKPDLSAFRFDYSEK